MTGKDPPVAGRQMTGDTPEPVKDPLEEGADSFCCCSVLEAEAQRLPSQPRAHNVE